jgi:spore coat protein U-like protein
MMMNSSKLYGRKTLTLAVSVLALGVSAGAFGAASDDLDVSASITANCTIDASGGLAFGAYDPIVANKADDLPGSGTISVTCTNGSAVTIELDGGQFELGGPAAAAPARRMNDSGANYLTYTLYSNPGLTTLWATGAAVDVDDTGTGVASNHTVYGVVDQDQNVPEGNYSDTVSATVTF